MPALKLISVVSFAICSNAWMMSPHMANSRARSNSALWSTSPSQSVAGSKHGQDACFLPLEQLDQECFAPRVIQV